ncbi:hypothetical protein [Actinomadura sp. J1-007]|uniref:hypothetical protein n=1 Tax=Actinomadura sp. J1-007 TaxID=2661913 RepID=UPI001F502E3A|nr:hypothetical protein [Actinomadura sp. J1-007]
MPRGTYVHLDDDLTERFQCAPGPGGWRYVGERADGVRTDLVVDGRWRQIRVEVVAPSWWLRGGVTGHDLAWVRGPAADGADGGAARAGGAGRSTARGPSRSSGSRPGSWSRWRARCGWRRARRPTYGSSASSGRRCPR